MKDGPMVEETVVRLQSEGNTLYEWRCTPTDLSALVIGRLYVEGMIDDAGVASELELTPDANGDVAITMAALPNAQRPVRARPPGGDLPEPGAMAELFRALFATVDERHESGGMHAAALADERGIAFQAEDVGRHNTVDKVIGMALLQTADPSRFGLLVSSRVSGEIARKAARAGVAWLASRSIPTTLAVRIAAGAAMPIIGRAAGKHAFIYR